MTSADEPGRPDRAGGAAPNLQNMPVHYTRLVALGGGLDGSPDLMLRHPPGGGAPYVAYRDDPRRGGEAARGAVGPDADTPGVGRAALPRQNVNGRRP